jgi:maleylpyruvate isomerase
VEVLVTATSFNSDATSGSDLTAVLRDVDAATQRVIQTAAGLDDEQVLEASLCPGWSRAHVLAHLAGNADGNARVLNWIATGERQPKYSSYAVRNAEIEEGAKQSHPDLITALKESAARVADEVNRIGPERLGVAVPTGPGGTDPELTAAEILWTRLRELEVHHVDLNAGYTPAHWSDEFAVRAMAEALNRMAKADPSLALVVEATDTGTSSQIGPSEGAVFVTGPVRALTAWLTGRGSGDGLVVEPPGKLPDLPPWG